MKVICRLIAIKPQQLLRLKFEVCRIEKSNFGFVRFIGCREDYVNFRGWANQIYNDNDLVYGKEISRTRADLA